MCNRKKKSKMYLFIQCLCAGRVADNRAAAEVQSSSICGHRQRHSVCPVRASVTRTYCGGVALQSSNNAWLITACSTGNLALYDQALSQYELFFERHGLYVLLEKLKLIAFRNLIRKMYVLLPACCAICNICLATWFALWFWCL